VAINLQFQSLPSANNEILKAFNSQNAAKALEAYQGLDIKQRKREKLRALQLLKQSSESSSLADISLDTDSLAVSLKQADGPTLQAMLNLLSSKMIEQNKTLSAQEEEEEESQEEKLKAKIKRKAEKVTTKDKQENQEQNDSEESEEEVEVNFVQEWVDSVTSYIDELRDRILQSYDDVLDALSMERLKDTLEETQKTLTRYLYEMPVEFVDEHFISPVQELPSRFKNYVDIKIKSALEHDIRNTFSAEEIRSILNKTMKKSVDESLEKTIGDMDSNLRYYSKKQRQKKLDQETAIKSTKNVKLALHNI